jgi:hypothetical protein
MYFSKNIIRVIKSRRMRWEEHVADMGKTRGAYRVFDRRPERKGPGEKPRRKGDDNIKTYLKRSVSVADWIYVAQNREKWQALVNAVMNFRVP